MNALIGEASNYRIYARSRAKQLKLQLLGLKFSSPSLFQVGLRNEDDVLELEDVINDSLNPTFEKGRLSAKSPQSFRIFTENIEDNSYKNNAMSFDYCSFAEEQQSENDEKIIEQGSSNDGDEEKNDDMKAMKILAKSYNMHIVNNKTGGDCIFRSVSVALYEGEDQFEYVREIACNYLEARKNEDDFMYQFVSTEEAKIEKIEKEKNFNRYIQAEVEENIDQYIAKMSSSHEWADGPILEATGREYRRQINVSLPSGQSYSLNHGQRLHIDLGFVNCNHQITFVNRNKE
ncbi:MAG: hypothetical protein EZS28_002407 [Streblomastix strix]|uniref:OTU domain-containing protein n=1 Tax=Streblomastix strix TaxID=222440 RepID=A0A5J4X521_9EUKA|nr:MAG: hypothetical protein EZS28_002407 [Streblomastix strix]